MGSRRSLAVVFAVFCGSASLSAEPITLTYQVTVTPRIDLQSRTTEKISPISVVMSVSFDGRINLRHEPPHDEWPLTGAVNPFRAAYRLKFGCVTQMLETKGELRGSV